MTRLTYEAFAQKHIETYYTWRNNPAIAKFDQSVFVAPMNYEEVKAWCEMIIESKSGFTYFVRSTPLDRYIGICALMNVDYKNSHAELSIVIGDQEVWGQGYGTEIMKQLFHWGFVSLNLHKLFLHVFAYNERAIGLYEKMGMVREGTFEDEVYYEGQYYAVYRYRLLREVWQANEVAQ